MAVRLWLFKHDRHTNTGRSTCIRTFAARAYASDVSARSVPPCRSAAVVQQQQVTRRAARLGRCGEVQKQRKHKLWAEERDDADKNAPAYSASVFPLTTSSAMPALAVSTTAWLAL